MASEEFQELSVWPLADAAGNSVLSLSIPCSKTSLPGQPSYQQRYFCPTLWGGSHLFQQDVGLQIGSHSARNQNPAADTFFPWNLLIIITHVCSWQPQYLLTTISGITSWNNICFVLFWTAFAGYLFAPDLGEAVRAESIRRILGLRD